VAKLSGKRPRVFEMRGRAIVDLVYLTPQSPP
jgi:hypothetical protein